MYNQVIGVVVFFAIIAISCIALSIKEKRSLRKEIKKCLLCGGWIDSKKQKPQTINGNVYLDTRTPYVDVIIIPYSDITLQIKRGISHSWTRCVLESNGLSTLQNEIYFCPLRAKYNLDIDYFVIENNDGVKDVFLNVLWIPLDKYPTTQYTYNVSSYNVIIENESAIDYKKELT